MALVDRADALDVRLVRGRGHVIVADQAEGAARSERGGRQFVAAIRIEPMEGSRRDDEIERSGFDERLLERRVDDPDVRPASHPPREQVGHATSRFDCRDPEPTLRERNGQFAGPCTDLEDVGAGWLPRSARRVLDRLLGVAGSVAVVRIRDPVEDRAERPAVRLSPPHSGTGPDHGPGARSAGRVRGTAPRSSPRRRPGRRGTP